jgi:hypothetical protein
MAYRDILAVQIVESNPLWIRNLLSTYRCRIKEFIFSCCCVLCRRSHGPRESKSKSCRVDNCNIPILQVLDRLDPIVAFVGLPERLVQEAVLSLDLSCSGAETARNREGISKADFSSEGLRMCLMGKFANAITMSICDRNRKQVHELQ